MASTKQKIWTWYFFDFASQPYNTLLLTFIFAPYVAKVLGDGTQAQTVWGYGVAAAGFVIALGGPFLGAMADRGGRRMGFIAFFSALYVIGSAGLWAATPGGFPLLPILFLFGLGLIGMEFATSFTNAMMPDLAKREELGRLSGSGWAFGYVGGILSLALMLAFFAETPNGLTLLGQPPALGLDASQSEGTRAAGPLTALWYLLFMLPFFLWLRDPPKKAPTPWGAILRQAGPDLWASLRRLPARQSLMAHLLSSMFYRDALNGVFTFGGIYAAGVLGWGVTDVGLFGIVAALSAALFAWVGGRADQRFGPKPVISVSLGVLTLATLAIAFVGREAIFFLPLTLESQLPDIAFYLLGAIIGGAGGALQAASRHMMIRQADPARLTEAFGLYALAGKATSFLAPFFVALITQISGSQSLGVLPLVLLFLLGAAFLTRVHPEGERY